MLRNFSFVAVVCSLLLCSCSTNEKKLTIQQEDSAYEKKEFKPTIDEVLNESAAETKEVREKMATPTPKPAH